jgi:hypothetical protein
MTGGADDHGTVVIARDAAMPAVQRARNTQARSAPRRVLTACLLLLLVAAVGPAVAAPAPDAASLADAGGAATKTGKERLTDKASDEQRANDCKVPPARRTRARSADCQ